MKKWTVSHTHFQIGPLEKEELQEEIKPALEEKQNWTSETKTVVANGFTPSGKLNEDLLLNSSINYEFFSQRLQ